MWINYVTLNFLVATLKKYNKPGEINADNIFLKIYYMEKMIISPCTLYKSD